jgi:hypothetical protein
MLVAVSTWLPLICCVSLMILDARFAGRPPAGWDHALSLAMTSLAGAACLMNVLIVAYQVAAVSKRRAVRRPEQRMFSAVTGLLTYAFLDGWGISRLNRNPAPFYLWAALAMMGGLYFELQPIFASLAKIRAKRRTEKHSGKNEEP